MNALPEHRRAISGRTYSQSWSASSFDPIRHYRSSMNLFEHLAGYALAITIGVAIGAAIGFGVRA